MSYNNLNDVASMSIAAESFCRSTSSNTSVANSAVGFARNDNPHSKSELINNLLIIDVAHGRDGAESVLFTPAAHDKSAAMKVLVARHEREHEHERERESDTSVKFPLNCTLRVGKFPCELAAGSIQLLEHKNLTTSFSADCVLTDSWRNFALELNAHVMSNGGSWPSKTFPSRSCHYCNNNKFPLSQQRATCASTYLSECEAEAHVVDVKCLLNAMRGSVQADARAKLPNLEDDAAPEVATEQQELLAKQQPVVAAKFPTLFMHTADPRRTFISSARSVSAHASRAAECTMLEVLAQLAAIQQSQVPNKRTPTARVECATSTCARGEQFHKFPIIKKQFFNFPMRPNDADLHDMAIRHEIDNYVEGVQHTRNAGDVGCMVKDIAPGEEHQGQTLNLNEQNFDKCVNFRIAKAKGNADAEAENASAAVTDRMAMVDGDMSTIKHQQAENFNDAFEICDAMKLRGANQAKNNGHHNEDGDAVDANDADDDDDDVNEQSKLLEIFERAENMSKIINKIISATTKTTTTTTPTLSKNLADDEEQQSICSSAEHSFSRPDGRTNNSVAAVTDDNNHHHHQQQKQQQQQQQQQQENWAERSVPPERSQFEQRCTSSKRSDVRETSFEPEEEQTVSDASSASPNAKANAKAEAIATVTSNTRASVPEAQAAATTTTSLAVPASTPNIELLAAARADVVDISYVIGDYVASDADYSGVNIDVGDANDDDDDGDDAYEFVSAYDELLSDVIDLIETTTEHLISVLLLTNTSNIYKQPEEQEQANEGKVISAVEPKQTDMTVTKAGGEVGVDRNEKLIKDKFALRGLDTMKLELRGVKGALPTNDTAPSNRIRDARDMRVGANTPRTHVALSGSAAMAGRRESLSRLNESVGKSSSAGQMTASPRLSLGDTKSRLTVGDNKSSSLSPRSSVGNIRSTTQRLNVGDSRSTTPGSSLHRHNMGDVRSSSSTSALPRLGGVGDARSTVTASAVPRLNVGESRLAASSNALPRPGVSDIRLPAPMATTSRSLDFKRLSSQDSLESVLPERTRLRRQRRMLSQESVEEKPEDVMERLNKIKARISGALSEVKGVLKQYSTESEAEVVGEPLLRPEVPITPSPSQEAAQEESPKESCAPVQFRFVRKVRRRSVFEEEDEYKEDESGTKIDETEKNIVKEGDSKIIATIESETKKENLLDTKPVGGTEQNEAKTEVNMASRIVPSEVTREKLQTGHTTVQINGDAVCSKEQTEELPKRLVIDVPDQKNIQSEKPENSNDPGNKKLEFLHKVHEVLNKKPETKADAAFSETKDQIDLCKEDKTVASDAALSTPNTAKTKSEGPEEASDDATPITKPKKKIVHKIIKTHRRASIAAVEGSKIEPAIQDVVPLVTIKEQRRPSDSEAIIIKKKKKTIAKITDADEVASAKVKSISKVKRATMKGATTATSVSNERIATKTINQLQQNREMPTEVEEGIEEAQTAKKNEDDVDKNDNNVANNSNKDVIVPSTITPTKKEAAAPASALVSVTQSTTTTTITTTIATSAPKQLNIDGERVNGVVASASPALGTDVAITVAVDAAMSAKQNANAVIMANTAKTTQPKLFEQVAAVADADADAATFAVAAAAKTAIKVDNSITEINQSRLPASERNGHRSGNAERISDKLANLVGETIATTAAAAAATAASASPIKSTQDNKIITTTTTAAANTQATSASSESRTESKKPIHQPQIKIPAGDETSVSGQQHKQAPSEQQVANGVAASTADDIGGAVASTSVEPQIARQRTLRGERKGEQQAAAAATAAATAAELHVDATKVDVDVCKTNIVATGATATASDEQQENSQNEMPELKVSTGPVQPVKLGADGAISEQVPFDMPPHTDGYHVDETKKKKVIKRIVRKNSIDKAAAAGIAAIAKEKATEVKLSNLLKDKNKISDLASNLDKLVPPKKQAPKIKAEPKQENDSQERSEDVVDDDYQVTSGTDPDETSLNLDQVAAIETAEAVKPKTERKIKKKVIIKRQKRRLSISDTFFTQPEPEEPKVPEIETIERAIAYVTDDEAHGDDEVDGNLKSKDVVAKPLKSCLRLREYKVGELIMYAERYRKTQVKWKRGRVLERITSISYKLDIEGKEVPAHISYIKKWTGRKVNFGGKEYLEIDYEQVAEEERRARSYSIWNMV